MPIDFDEIIDRRGTHCEKWDGMEKRYGVSPEDGIAMWVADMDFKPPQAVGEALQRMVEHGVFGYPGDESKYREAICGWMSRRHRWEIQPEWICVTHGIVNAMNLIIQAFCRPGDEVVLQSPVYYPFFSSVRNNGCHVVNNELVRGDDGKYRMDLGALETQVTSRTKLMLLCSPHNPGGRVWSREELTKLVEFCFSRNILLVADEIHHDLVYEGSVHTVLAALDEEVADKVIVCTSATKTFNIAGTFTGNVIIKNARLRKQFLRQVHRVGIYEANSFGMAATTAAYAQGDEWLDALRTYLAGNRDRVQTFMAQELPHIDVMPLDATYLSWMNFSACTLPMDDVIQKVQKEAKLALNHGYTFGPGGEQSLRLNFACPRSVLDEALTRLKRVLK